MKDNTLKWIIGCLTGVIVILMTLLIVKELNIVTITFADGISVASTLSSIILSVLAIYYTFSSAREGRETNNQIQSTLTQINLKATELAELTKYNTEMLKTIQSARKDVEAAIELSSKTLDIINKQGNMTEAEKESVIQNIEKTKSSMSMFLNRMSKNS